MQLVEKYEPKRLEDFVGVDRQRAIMSHLVANPYSSAWLLIGPSGCGKTTMAFAAAHAIGGQIYHVPAATCDLAMVESISRKCHFRPFVGNWNIVIVDESDRMTGPAQISFLSTLDGTNFPPDTIFIFTANGAKTLEARFLSRIRNIRFELNDIYFTEGADLLKRIWKAEKAAGPPPNFLAILQASGGNIRSALMELEVEMIAPGTFIQPAVQSPLVETAIKRAVAKSVPPPARSAAAKELITAQDLAIASGVDVATIYKWLQVGKLPSPVSRKPLTWRKHEVLAA